MDVLFVDLPFTTYELGRRFKAAWTYKQRLRPYELHLGFRYMVSTLREHGYSADIAFPAGDDGLAARAELLRTVADIQPDILAFTSYEGSLQESLDFIRQAKREGVHSLICLGGHLATFSYDKILADFPRLVDVIVRGEGEHTIVELAQAVKAKEDWSQVQGIAYHNGSRVIATELRPAEPNINRFPFPALPEVDGWLDSTPLFITTSRGCYGHCSFCRSSHFGEGWRARDPQNVVDEIENAYHHGVSTFELVDDNFVGPGIMGKRRAAAIAAEVKRRGLDIRFHASCRVNDVDEATMRLLKEAGLISVSLGVESGVPRMLQTFCKNATVEQNLAALALLNSLDIPTLVYIIFFDPYVTLDECQENIQFLKKIRSFGVVRFEEIIFRSLIPISGTPLFDQIQDHGLLNGNYLTGHSFMFRDSRVSLLADWLETVDLRFERIFQDEAFGKIHGFYRLFKEVFEVSVAEQAVELLASARCEVAEAQRRLDDLLGKELRRTFGAGLEAAPAPV